MNLEEALNTAIEYEEKVTAVYDDAGDKIQDPIGKRIFKVLADEEEGHVAYLKSRLEEWQKDGKITVGGLVTAIPSKEKIDKAVSELDTGVSKEAPGTEIEMLKNALDIERKTTAYYEKMVSEIPGEEKELFSRFLEIEKGHEAIVEAELNSVSGLGVWFDMEEFDLEAG